MRNTYLPFSPPLIGEEEINEVIDTLKSDWITTGPKTKKFEEEFKSQQAKENIPGVFSESSKLQLRNKIKIAKDNNDWVILNYHGGVEFSHYPAPYQIKKLKQFINMGVDIIICHHPHVVQVYDKINDNKYIFYSLGNFLFELDYHAYFQETNESIIPIFEFNKKSFKFHCLFTNYNKFDKRISLSKVDNNFKRLDKNYIFFNWINECHRIFSTRKKIMEFRLKKIMKILLKILNLFLFPTKYQDLLDYYSTMNLD